MTQEYTYHAVNLSLIIMSIIFIIVMLLQRACINCQTNIRRWTKKLKLDKK